jgi:hypothetical protein
MIFMFPGIKTDLLVLLNGSFRLDRNDLGGGGGGAGGWEDSVCLVSYEQQDSEEAIQIVSVWNLPSLGAMY